jgi:hypothetical protein
VPESAIYVSFSVNFSLPSLSFSVSHFLSLLLSLCSSYEIHIVLEVSLGIVCYLGFDKFSIVGIHHYNVIQYNFTALKILHVFPSSMLPHEDSLFSP